MKINKFFIFCLLLVSLSACKSKNNNSSVTPSVNNEVEISPAVFPVTDFFKGQLIELEDMPITPLRITAQGNRTDSLWSKRENIREFAKPFLSPLIDSVSMQKYYDSKSFLDQTINAITIMYDANDQLPGDISLTHFDVYINPLSNKVKRIYMVKKPSVDSTVQLTWTVNKSCSIVTIVQAPNQKPVIKEDKMIWGFD